MSTFSTLPVRLCCLSLMKVSVIAVTLSILPLSQSAVSMQWASKSPVTPLPAACGVEPPEPVTPLRQVGRDRPVLQEDGPIMEDLPQAAFVDEILGQRDGRHAAVVVPDHIGHAGLLDRLDHLGPFGRIHRQGLFAQHHLSGLGRGDGDVVVQVVGHADVDGVDIFPREQLPPVGLDRLVSPFVGELLGGSLIPRTNGLEHGPVIEVKKIIDAPIRVRMGPAHEAVADQADV